MRLVVIAVCAFAVACASRSADQDLDSLEASQRFVVEVRNQNFYDATIYVVLGVARIRLGIVRGNATGSFTRRWSSPTAEFEVRLLSVGAYTSYNVPVNPGDVIEVTIPPDLHTRGGRRRP